jgi:SMODS-associating 2TM, beta-strand rich effector domain
LASNHEYAVIGHSRAMVGRYLGIIAGLASSGLAVLIATAITYAEQWGLLQTRAYWTLPLTAAIFYTLGHLAFDKWAWRTWLVHFVLDIPDLRGKWDCAGETIDASTGAVTHNWTAVVTISQGWEKIRIYVQTAQSRSRSVAASIVVEEDLGYILMYSYRNEPRPGEPELKAHHGYAEWHIAADGSSAEATYFNGGGRFTGGRMKLTRKTRGN